MRPSSPPPADSPGRRSDARGSRPVRSRGRPARKRPHFPPGAHGAGRAASPGRRSDARGSRLVRSGGRPAMKRRHFLLGAIGAGGALVVGWGLLPPRGRLGTAELLPPSAGRIALNAWVRIGEDGSASLVMPRVEMGQGVHTAIPMLLAEELRLPLERIRLEQPPPHAIYGNVAMWLKYLPFPPGDGAAGEE